MMVKSNKVSRNVSSKKVKPVDIDESISFNYLDLRHTFSITDILHSQYSTSKIQSYFEFIKKYGSVDFDIVNQFKDYKFKLVNIVLNIITNLKQINLVDLYNSLINDPIIKGHLIQHYVTIKFSPTTFSGLRIKYHFKSNKTLKFTFLIFTSGKIVAAGVKSNREEFISVILAELKLLLQHTGKVNRLKIGYKIVNMVFKFTLPFFVNFNNLNKFHGKDGLIINYEALLFPGLSAQYIDYCPNTQKNIPSPVFVLYSSGESVLTGQKNDQDAFKKIVQRFFKVLNSCE